MVLIPVRQAGLLYHVGWHAPNSQHFTSALLSPYEWHQRGPQCLPVIRIRTSSSVRSPAGLTRDGSEGTRCTKLYATLFEGVAHLLQNARHTTLPSCGYICFLPINALLWAF